jgi:ABC-type polysaccharide transport system permease subunit
VRRVALVFVHFPHDEVLDMGEWVCLFHFREVFEREVLMQVLYNVCLKGGKVLVFCMYH